MKATIRTYGNMTFMDFFNSSSVFSIKGFDTVKKAKNYAKKWNIEVFESLPTGVKEFQYND